VNYSGALLAGEPIAQTPPAPAARCQQQVQAAPVGQHDRLGGHFRFADQRVGEHAGNSGAAEIVTRIVTLKYG
jgi:hypothetical protein